MSGAYIEQGLSPKTKNIHRALSSLQEELEAVDYYAQREDQADDPELREILAHNRREETEHAAMLIEWLRRNAPDFDENLRDYLFTSAPITELEEGGEEGDGGGSKKVSGSLGIGAMRS